MPSQTTPKRPRAGLGARLEARRGAVVATAGSYGAQNIGLFGSFARGDHADASKVDLPVDFEDGAGLFQVARLVAALEACGDSHVDVVNTGALRPWDDDVFEEAVSFNARLRDPDGVIVELTARFDEANAYGWGFRRLTEAGVIEPASGSNFYTLRTG